MAKSFILRYMQRPKYSKNSNLRVKTISVRNLKAIGPCDDWRALIGLSKKFSHKHQKAEVGSDNQYASHCHIFILRLFSKCFTK